MRIVIVEDEPIVAQRLERLVRRIRGSNASEIEVANSLSRATELLTRAQDAVLLLDLNLSGEDGFDILRRAVAESFQTIVVSANTDRAVEAFELGVVDFVPKPFSEERLAMALERVDPAGKRQERQPTFLAVTLAGRVDLVRIESIVAIHGADDYSELETEDGGRHLHKKTLSTLERFLPSHFRRVHRSHLVNLRFAAGLTVESSGRRILQLSNGSHVPVSRAHGKTFKDQQ